ncbi:MAG: hypothetical protein OHK0038_02950 [Flammeovirgaceae bacterium]
MMLVFKILIVAGIFLGMTMPTYGQVAQKGDFLNKPELWKKITENYNDSLTWSSYIGLPWACMSLSDRKYIQSIREAFRKESAKVTKLTNNTPADNNFWGDASDQSNTNYTTELAAKEKALYNNQLENVISEEPPVIADLKKNLSQNFVLIEDTFKDEFEMFGGKYEYYSQVHPDKKYSQELWVSEKSKELKELKRKKYTPTK